MSPSVTMHVQHTRIVLLHWAMAFAYSYGYEMPRRTIPFLESESMRGKKRFLRAVFAESGKERKIFWFLGCGWENCCAMWTQEMTQFWDAWKNRRRKGRPWGKSSDWMHVHVIKVYENFMSDRWVITPNGFFFRRYTHFQIEKVASVFSRHFCNWSMVWKTIMSKEKQRL